MFSWGPHPTVTHKILDKGGENVPVKHGLAIYFLPNLSSITLGFWWAERKFFELCGYSFPSKCKENPNRMPEKIWLYHSTHYCSSSKRIVAYEFLLVLAAEDFGGRVLGEFLEGRKLQILGALKAANLKYKYLYAQPGQCVVLLKLKQY